MSEAVGCNGGSDLGTRVKGARDRVLELWEKRARQTLPKARRQDRLALRDGLPGLLDELAGVVGDGITKASAGEQTSHNASCHGRQRAEETECSLDEVLREYELLRRVLIEVIDSERPLTLDEREVLTEQIQLRVAASAKEFERIRDEEREGARRQLENLNAGLEKTVGERTRELTRSEARLRTLVDGVKDYAIFTIDPLGFVTSWNEGAQRMKQYTAEEIIGAHFSVLYTEQGRLRDEPMAHLRAAALEGRFRGEGVRRRKNGETFMADVLITPMYDGEALTGFSKVVQDLTERSSLLQERDLLRVDANRLRCEAQERERFVAALFHDLRSPLSAAKTGAQLIARGGHSPAKLDELAKRISNAVDRADRMLVDLLDASRIDAGQGIRLDLEECDLVKIAEEECADHAARHGARFSVIAEDDVKGMWNAEALRRVLDNLLTNAVKYGDPSTPITVRLRSRAQRRLMFVHNFGPSISVKDQAELFQPFHRARLAEASGKKGWGLGLTLVRGLVKSLNGEVVLASYPNEGTTFTVDLPVDSRAPR
jgi:PAS domain S-box-containing protein